MSVNAEPRAVLWDMDGTLLDSHEAHWLAWREAGETEGFGITFEDFHSTFGQRNDVILRRLLGEDVPAERIEEISRSKEAMYRRIVRKQGARLLPGAIQWLQTLERDGWRQALATSAPPENVAALLDLLGIRRYFEAVVHGSDVPRSKPDPQVYLLAAGRLGIQPDRCIVIEDAAAGIEGARRAGMRCIAVGPAHAVLPADVRVPSLEELPADAAERLLG